MILVIGWVCFFISWICNIIYYKVHPSGVDFNLGRSRARLFIYFLGKKVKFPGYQGGDRMEVEGAQVAEDEVPPPQYDESMTMGSNLGTNSSSSSTTPAVPMPTSAGQ